MTGHFGQLQMLHLLWLVLALAGLHAYAAWRRRQDLELFADKALLPKINVSGSPARRFWKVAFALAACALLICASVRPRWGLKPREITRMGRDVVFLLDVSKSMLAQDRSPDQPHRPSRLERAKTAIADCAAQMEGDRVGLVVFAGTAVVKCPLTLDYGFFRMMLDDVSPDSVSRGGTMIGDALRKVVEELFDEREKRYQDIVLITDGEDHESFPVQAAEKAGARGVRLIAVGFGSEEGSAISVESADGKEQEIRTRLDAETLRKMADATQGGRYFHVEAGAIDLSDVYREVIASAERREVQSQAAERYEEKFQIFLGLALVFLCADLLISERRRK